MSKTIEALRLADALEVRGFLGTTAQEASAELRRLHALNQRLAESNVELLQTLERIATAAEATVCNTEWIAKHARAALTAAFQERSSVEQPAPPPECKTDAEKTAYAFGWFKALEANRGQPAQGKSFYLNSEQPAHCEAGPEFCQQCQKEAFENRSLALAAAFRYVKNHTPHLVWTEIERALQKQPEQQEPLTDEQCDAIYYALDVWSREFDQHEFGLPATCGGGMEGGRAIIRAAYGIHAPTERGEKK